MTPPAARREGRRRHAACVYGYTTAQWGSVRDKLPMVPVVLSWGTKGFRTKMLLDTGATSTFLIPDIAEYLGLEILENRPRPMGRAEHSAFEMPRLRSSSKSGMPSGTLRKNTQFR